MSAGFSGAQAVWCPVTVEMVAELSKNELLVWTALHQFGADFGRATPSLAVICKITGLSETSTQEAKRGLIAKRYLSVEPQFSEGRQTYNRYVALKAPPGWRVLPAPTEHPQATEPAPLREGAENPQGGVREEGTHEGAGKPHPDYRETNTHQSPPTPQGGDTGQKGKKKAPTREGIPLPTLTRERVPDDLAPVADLLIDYWNNHKAGSRTEKSLAGQITNIRNILQASSMDAVRGQLSQAIEISSCGGSKWQAITFSNWQQYRGLAKNGASGYGRPAGSPGGSSGSGPSPLHPSLKPYDRTAS
jgi:hypothetical protein